MTSVLARRVNTPDAAKGGRGRLRQTAAQPPQQDSPANNALASLLIDTVSVLATGAGRACNNCAAMACCTSRALRRVNCATGESLRAALAWVSMDGPYVQHTTRMAAALHAAAMDVAETLCRCHTWLMRALAIWCGGNLVLGLVYFGLAWVGLAMAAPGDNASPLWPAAGLALAAVWRFGPGLLPGVWLGQFLGNLFVFHGPPVAAALVGVGGAASALVGWWVLRRLGARCTLERVQDVGLLLIAAVCFASVSAAIGPVISTALAALDWATLPVRIWLWFSGDLVGIIAVAPLVCLLPPFRPALRPPRPELAALLLLLGTCMLAVVLVTDPAGRTLAVMAMGLPALVWAALRAGPAGAAVVGALVTVAAGYALSRNDELSHHHFGSLTRLGLQQTIVFSYAVSGLVVGAMAASQANALAGLRASESRYRLVSDHANDLMCLHRLDGRYEWVSPSCQRLLGWTPAELIGQDPYALFHPDDAVRIRSGPDQQLLTGTVATFIQYRMRRADGSWVWLETTSRLVLDPAGQPIALHTASRDITSRRQDAQRLDEAQRTAVLAERMATIGTLAGGVAHEFNNLNAVILGHVDLMLADPAISPGQRRRLDLVHEAVDREGQVVSALLTFAGQDRRRPSDMGQADVTRTIRTTVDLATVALRNRGVELILDLPADAVTVLGSAGSLGQVLLNLLLNAADAVADRPNRQVRVRVDTDTPNEVHVQVIDQGVGIATEDLPLIFNPFYSTKGEWAPEGRGQPHLKGTGLGLSVCQTLVHQLGGRILVASVVGQGTTFTVVLRAG